MINLGFSVIGSVKGKIVVCLEAHIFVICHSVVCALNDMVAGRAHCDQRLIFVPCGNQRSDRGELGSDLVASHGINAAAALPLGQFFELYAESLGRKSCVCIKILCLVSQRTAGIVAVCHS